MIIPEIVSDLKLIPLYNNSKISKVKWGTSEKLSFTGEESGYGIDTGRSGLVVVDCDNKDGMNSTQSFLEMYLRESGEIPSTLTVETPNRGTHFYFKNTSNLTVKSSVSKLLKNVDIRADGGYVVGPGSKVVDRDGNIQEYIIENEEVDIAPIPEWLLKKLTSYDKKTQAMKEMTDTDSHSSRPNNDELEQIHALKWAIDKMREASEGSRNSVLNHTSYFMGVKRVPVDKARELVSIALEKQCPREEAERTFSSAYQKGLEQETTNLDSIVKEYNTKNGVSFKEDPMDSEFYGHVSLSWNFWLKYRNELLFWRESEKWYKYDSSRGIWMEAIEEELRSTLKTFLEKLVFDIRKDTIDKIPANIYKLQEKLWMRSTIDAVLVLARSDFLVTSSNLFDSQPYYINCKNGVYDLETGKLLDHSPNLFLTKYIPLKLNLEATDEYCDKVLECVAPEERDFLQLIAGQSLVGEQPTSQAVFFLLGRGSNGKSTFINLMLKTSGTYGKLQPPSVFLPDKGREVYAMADFEGLRTAIVEELPDAKTLNSGSLKRLSGTQKINAREIYSKNREFENQSTIFVSCNRLPMVNETDEGTWRRLLVINFPYSYKKNSAQIKNDWDRLGDPLVIYSAISKTKTAEAFLAWRVEGAIKWMKNKKAEFNVPKSVEKTVEEWNENNDLVLAWFNDTFEIDFSSYVLVTDAHNCFNNWSHARNNAKVSLRFFLQTFLNHKTFLNNNIVHKSRSKVPKELNLTRSYDPSDEIRAPHKNNISHFVGLKFKEK